MNDRELLEMAAKAVGFSHEIFIDGKSIRRDLDGQPIYWNPLTDDGDALRLAVKLNLITKFTFLDALAEENDNPAQDYYVATRRAIVRAAAEIGKAMP